jgi:type II restriction enzyme
MANSDFLRKNKNQHSVKNAKSKKMDSDIMVAVKKMIRRLHKKYPQLVFEHKKQLLLSTIIDGLCQEYPEYSQDFSQVMEKSSIKPDGGFLYATDKNGNKRLILIAEVKRQGTNDKRKNEGLPEQSRGNAVERLGKNLIGIRAIFKKEEVIPFVCFGSGDDFRDKSTIRDRVITMNDFFPLKKLFIQKNYLPFEPVSMFFRHKNWTMNEMLKIITDVVEMTIKYHFSIN